MLEHKGQLPEPAFGGHRDIVFLLRCWLEEPGGEKTHSWRFRIIGRDDDQIPMAFTRLDDLFEFLAEQIEPKF